MLKIDARFLIQLIHVCFCGNSASSNFATSKAKFFFAASVSNSIGNVALEEILLIASDIVYKSLVLR